MLEHPHSQTIHPLDAVRHEHVARRAARDYRPIRHQRDAIGEHRRQRQVVYDGDGGQPVLAAEVERQAERIDLVLDVEVRRRLVE